MTWEEPVFVIGAGVAGLSAAIHLAAAGRKVSVYEKNECAGGKMGEVRMDGFRWDTGPSVITMRWVLEDLFRSAGRKLDDYLDLLPIEPVTRYFYPDGSTFDVTHDLTRMVEAISAIHPPDVEGYLAYLAYTARLHRITGPAFIYGPPPSLEALKRVNPLDIFRFDPLRTMQQAINGFVHSNKLRQLLGRYATYVGASPYQAPATLNVIAHVELNGGVWYPRGGIYQIARALEMLAHELGVEIKYGKGVSEIMLQDSRVTGIVLEDGRKIRSKCVVANVDVSMVYEKLLHAYPPTERQWKQLAKNEPSCSGLVLLLGVKGHHPGLAHHNILFSRDPQKEFREIFNEGIPPGEPTIYLAVTSKTDPSHAPGGCENWFVLVNAPALSDRFDWGENLATYREVVLDRLAAFGLDVEGKVLTEVAITPIELERQTWARRGALYGTSSNERLAAFRRPHNRSKEVRGLYFCGGTAHPGGGVPMVMLSAKTAVRFLLEDLG